MREIKRQNGAALILVSTLLLGVMVTLIATVSLRAKIDRRLEDVNMGTLDQRLDNAQALAYQQYEALAPTMDAAPAAPVSPAQFLVDAGVRPQWRVRAFIGSRQASGSLAWRNVYLWIPPRNKVDTTSYTPSTDTFTPDPDAKWRIVQGRRIQERRMNVTVATLRRLGKSLSARYIALLDLDPLHNPLVNRFQQGVIAGGYLTLAAIGYSNALGLSSNDQLDAWGGQILASNTVDCNTAAPPYDMRLRAITPWGGIIDTTVTQP